MNCPKCGAELNENAKFCGKCGAPIKIVEPEVSSKEEVSEMNKSVSEPESKKPETSGVVQVAVPVTVAAAKEKAAELFTKMKDFVNDKENQDKAKAFLRQCTEKGKSAVNSIAEKDSLHAGSNEGEQKENPIWGKALLYGITALIVLVVLIGAFSSSGDGSSMEIDESSYSSNSTSHDPIMNLVGDWEYEDIIKLRINSDGSARVIMVGVYTDGNDAVLKYTNTTIVDGVLYLVNNGSTMNESPQFRVSGNHLYTMEGQPLTRK